VLAFGLLDLFWSMLWFFLGVTWIMLVLRVYADIFRSPDMGGGAKVAWLLFVIFLPLLGVLIYISTRGAKMNDHEIAAAQTRNEAMRSYMQQAVGGSVADEVAKLVQLRDSGVLSADEFAAAKAKTIG
jgi:ABC-type multidrug transport system fused ATPase/permease subunit